MHDVRKNVEVKCVEPDWKKVDSGDDVQAERRFVSYKNINSRFKKIDMDLYLRLTTALCHLKAITLPVDDCSLTVFHGVFDDEG